MIFKKLSFSEILRKKLNKVINFSDKLNFLLSSKYLYCQLIEKNLEKKFISSITSDSNYVKVIE